MKTKTRKGFLLEKHNQGVGKQILAKKLTSRAGFCTGKRASKAEFRSGKGQAGQNFHQRGANQGRPPHLNALQ